MKINTFGAGILVALTLVGSTLAAAKPNWTKVGDIAIGMTEQAVMYRHGGYPEAGHGVYTYRVLGGSIQVMFIHGRVCWMDLHGPTAPNFTLPDGVSNGTKIPYGKKWHGYTSHFADNVTDWNKTVRSQGRKIWIVLGTQIGVVNDIQISTACCR